MGREIVCKNSDGDETCRVTFECVDGPASLPRFLLNPSSGECVSTMVALNMRSIMFPIVGTVLAVAWLVVSFLKNLPLSLIGMILSIVVFVLSFFLLITPVVYPGLLAMAFAALAFSANKSGSGFEIKLTVIAGIFVFLAFAGLNDLAGGFGNRNIFDETMQGFFNEDCYRYYGTDLESPRCAQYLLFTAFIGFFIMMLVVRLFRLR